jgi:hypothetical protein
MHVSSRLFLAKRALRGFRPCMPAEPIQMIAGKGYCPLAGAIFADFVAVQNDT